MILRKALPEEAEACYQCIEDARAYHSSLGFIQWYPDYPTPALIRKDIELGRGYVFDTDGKVQGYCVLTAGEDPHYVTIDGAWRTDRYYGVIHRLAMSAEARGRKLSGTAFALIREHFLAQGVRAIRVDTQEENKVMQHVLAKEGFIYCGLIYLKHGPKLAYEWDDEDK